MSIDETNRFAADARQPGALRDALEQVGPGSPEARLDALLAIAAAHGYTFTAADYFHASQAQASLADGMGSAYPQYGFPYSSVPPIPPPMPT